MDFNKQYFSIWKEAWDLHKKYCNIQAADEQGWKNLDQECERIHGLHKGTPEQKLVESLLLAVVGELERRANGQTAGPAKET